ncbi:hypothetical protein KUTeg_007322 [Tegillarca granosa]|uniref:Uncharacterized protein n=1 Tax=Tegillarca granosa TaxID=220873 RepID=A0ABQ9FCX2_TEGGR|nr:hypothetical protein KUTeg_007322 [Tegillarca granosa]
MTVKFKELLQDTFNMPKRKLADSSSDGMKKVKKSNPKTKATKEDKTSSKKVKKSYPKLIEENTNAEQTEHIKFTAKIPTKNKKGELVFQDHPEFLPNMTPKEVLQAGKSYSGVSSPTYDEKVNTYKVKCGGSLEMWESSGWIHKQDPYGWFQWYCRFYQGRRSADDERQIGRWLRCAGIQGRWRNNLISKCVKSGCGFDNVGISPVVRQTLQHWGYRLTWEDFDVYAKKMKKKDR